MKHIDTVPKSLEGRNVLFISPVFHYYHLSIISALERAGATVHYIPTISPEATATSARNYYMSQFQGVKERDFDFFFQIRGENIPVEIYRTFSGRNTVLITYQWDSIANYDYTPLLPFFSKTYSFDRGDCENYGGLTYLPMFHEMEAGTGGRNRYKIFMVGGFAYWRYIVAREIQMICNRNLVPYYIKLKLPATTLIRAVANGKFLDPKIITLKKCSKEKYFDFLHSSEIVLDIPSPSQQGLTIRSIEAITAGKKLITSNANIAKEDFYSKEQVLILKDEIDERKVLSFIYSPSPKPPDMSTYRIDHWISTIFS